MSKKIVVIGAGFSSLSAACFLAHQEGVQVDVIERHEQAGGRARRLEKDGFVFDRGPSWYWMPEVFDRFFSAFGENRKKYYQIDRLDPSYRVFWEDDSDAFWDIPADYEAYKQMFEKQQKGAGHALDNMMKEAQEKYDIAMKEFILFPGLRWGEILNFRVLSYTFRLQLFQNVRRYIAKRFQNPKLCSLLEFPILFLGAPPEKTPALYTMMNYADTRLGTWYPQGGMYRIVEAMVSVAKKLGVQFHWNKNVQSIPVDQQTKKAKGVLCDDSQFFPSDVVVSGADYHHTEQVLLDRRYQNYSRSYWAKRDMAPSALLYYVGVDGKLDTLRHHNLFFDKPFQPLVSELYHHPSWPKEPLFYLNVPSITDSSVALEGKEALFLLIPIAPGIAGDKPALRKKYFEQCIERVERKTGQCILSRICFYESFGCIDFEQAYGAFKGNAYGLANTLRQTANLKPKCRNKKVRNLFYTGQLTVPGPGVPPALISGEIVAKQVVEHLF